MPHDALPAVACEALALLLEYPDAAHVERVREALAALSREAPEAARAAAPFAARLASGQALDLEELYARTFDWNPERALEIGWHLYGERYDRGAYLVQLRESLCVHGVDEGQNLPDHLATLLRLLPLLAPADAQRMAAQELLPAVRRIGAGFGEEDNPYRAVLAAVLALLSGVGAAAVDAQPAGGR
jgi:nitrate reductase delta subunit